MDDFFQAVQKATLPGVWAKGIALSRSQSVIQEKSQKGELTFRVLVSGRPVSPKVSLIPGDEDWFCDCEEKANPCSHVAAAVVALKTGSVVIPASSQSSKATELHYHFIALTTPQGTALGLERLIQRPGQPPEKLNQTLVSYVGGISSGRIAAAPLPATQEDFAIDQILGTAPSASTPLTSDQLQRLLKIFQDAGSVFFKGTPVVCSGRPQGIQAEVVAEKNGFRIRRLPDPSVVESFTHGAVRVGTQEGFQIRPTSLHELTLAEAEMLKGNGTFFSDQNPATLTLLISDILPKLKSKVHFTALPEKLPELRKVPPRIVVAVDRGSNGSLSVLPRLVYGDPPFAEVISDQLDLLQRGVIPERDLAAEKQWIRKLQTELFLQPRQRVEFQGTSALDLTRKLKQWEVQGAAQKAFEVKKPLVPSVHAVAQGLQISFASGDATVDAESVFKAWREDESFVPLVEGGFAPLPVDWLNRHGERILALLAAKKAREPVSALVIPQMALLLDEMAGSAAGSQISQISYDTAVESLMKRLKDTDSIPKASLPSDLCADLRQYQEKGVNWLSFLKEAKLGALLADDMGLGKTLQALCTLGPARTEKALIICPTSVLQAWKEQIQKFRPTLRVSSYYGPGRILDEKADVTLTTYGILRLDLTRLIESPWTTLVLDEAQTLKNPESQLAQAAHALARACPTSFRIALSGTPIENRIDDLWSQFEFINPGMLGKRDSFREEAATPGKLPQLRARIRPFILRRLKKDVAPELPSRTEIVLRCEFSEKEQTFYDSLLASTRQEVLQGLGQEKTSVFAMLEILLRLRQASCHPALVPGGEGTLPGSEPSSKLELLLQSLDSSLELGHRALIFSQWTSHLDLIQLQLENRSIRWSRLDGSTRDREKVVTEFQSEHGPSVLLISLKAGGVGLTLTAADHIYIMDPWWNPAVEDQAADRAHRIGQIHPVLIHRLVAQGTVEDRILELQKRKLQLAGSVLENSDASVSLTRDDLLSLLAV